MMYGIEWSVELLECRGGNAIAMHRGVQMTIIHPSRICRSRISGVEFGTRIPVWRQHALFSRAGGAEA